MDRNRFEHLCLEAEAGRDAFVRHPQSQEEGMISSCSLNTGQMVVHTREQETRCWDYQECEDLRHPKSGPMV